MSRFAPVRWRDDTGWEFRCAECASQNTPCYWPLTDEFWDKRAGMGRCRACWLVYWRRKAAQARAADIDLQRARDRARYRANRRVLLIKRRAYYEANRDAILAKARARYEARRAA